MHVLIYQNIVPWCTTKPQSQTESENPSWSLFSFHHSCIKCEWAISQTEGIIGDELKGARAAYCAGQHRGVPSIPAPCLG